MSSTSPQQQPIGRRNAREAEQTERWDAGTYGRSFADVYDEWYGDRLDTQPIIDLCSRLLGGSTGHVIELGVGTGRLALPLAAAGFRVTGIDASAPMLERLRAKPGAERLHLIEGDVAEPAAYPDQPADIVLAVFNLLCNLADVDAAARALRACAAALVPGGHLVVETFLTRPVPERERRLELKEITPGRVVLIATDADPSTSTIVGSHIELTDGNPVRLRPWRVRWFEPAEIDGLAAAAGLRRVDRWADAAATPFDPLGSAALTVYQRG